MGTEPNYIPKISKLINTLLLFILKACNYQFIVFCLISSPKLTSAWIIKTLVLLSK